MARRLIPVILGMAAAAATASLVEAQPRRAPAPSPPPASRDPMLFADRYFGGAAFALTLPMNDLRIPWPVRSIRVPGEPWELCEYPNFGGRCTIYRQDEGSIPPALQRVQSARPARAQGGAGGPGRGPGFGWREIGRLEVPDRGMPMTIQVPGREMYREIMVCAERRTVRPRRVEVRLRRGEDQRIDTPDALRAGDCSRPTLINRPPADIVSITVRFERDRDRYDNDRGRGRGRGRDDDGTLVIRAR